MVLYFDTETTGLYPGHIIQLSYIMDYGKNYVCKNFYFAVDYIEPSASAVHGYTVEALRELSCGLRFSDHIDEIAADFESADLIVAHNFKFDHGFMNAEFSNNFRQFTFKESFDTMRYFTNILKIPHRCGKGFKFPKLEEFCKASDVYPFEAERFVSKNFGYDGKTTHDAMYDTAWMFLAVKNQCEKLPDFNIYLSKYFN